MLCPTTEDGLLLNKEKANVTWRKQSLFYNEKSFKRSIKSPLPLTKVCFAGLKIGKFSLSMRQYLQYIYIPSFHTSKPVRVVK